MKGDEESGVNVRADFFPFFSLFRIFPSNGDGRAVKIVTNRLHPYSCITGFFVNFVEELSLATVFFSFFLFFRSTRLVTDHVVSGLSFFLSFFLFYLRFFFS